VALRDILLDTNAYSAFKSNNHDAIDVIRHATVIGINSIVIGELLAGFAAGSRDSDNQKEFNLFLASRRVKVLPVDRGTAEYYASIFKSLRQKGRPIPTNDMWIAATALQHGLAVFTYDGHFQYVDGLVSGGQMADLSI
jgi:predicted nucleic acid-binding protein